MKNAFLFAGLMLLLTGCSNVQPIKSTPAANFKDHSLLFSGLPLPMMFQGTATQWNDEYAVTAAHIPFVRKVVHRCQTKCDLVFIKRKAKHGTPRWREAVPGEKVYSSGYNLMMMNMSGEGEYSSTTFTSKNKKYKEPLAVHSAGAVKGMSGGALYAADGSIVGITVAKLYDVEFFGPPSKHSAHDYPILRGAIPYSMVKREWDAFVKNGGLER